MCLVIVLRSLRMFKKEMDEFLRSLMTNLNCSCLDAFLLDLLQKLAISINTVKLGTNKFKCKAGTSV